MSKRRNLQHPSTCSCSRRSFLRGTGVTLTGFGLASLFPTPLLQHAMAGTGSSERRILFIFLRGGNDGINAVIPHGDPDYSLANRPTLYIPPDAALNLNDFASLNPALAPMLNLYNDGQLAVLHRIGYQNSSQSHFDGQRIWENGDPTQSQLFEGWLYRYIHEHALSAGKELPALSVQALAPTLLAGEETFVNIANPANFDYVAPNPAVADKFAENWRKVHDQLVGLEPYRPVLSQTGVKLVDTLDKYDGWDQQNWNPLDPYSGWSLFPVNGATNQAGFAAESYAFFASLKVAALALLESNSEINTNGTRVAGTQLSGWDLHNNQGQLGGRHAELLSWVAYGFESLRTVLSGAANDPRNYPSIWEDTLVCTLSEFGRTTIENGSGGTDHAAASCQFLAGGRVNGGVYNCDPTTWEPGVMLERAGRYLSHRTDYRAVFWEILRDHMGAVPGSLESIFPGYTAGGIGSQELGLIQT